MLGLRAVSTLTDLRKRAIIEYIEGKYKPLLSIVDGAWRPCLKTDPTRRACQIVSRRSSCRCRGCSRQFRSKWRVAAEVVREGDEPLLKGKKSSRRKRPSNISKMEIVRHKVAKGTKNKKKAVSSERLRRKKLRRFWWRGIER